MRSPDHPENLGPYIDGERANGNYEEIRLHVEKCPQCREEARTLQEMDTLFRSRIEEIEVPVVQWQRIAARLEASPPASGLIDRLTVFLRQYRLAWGTALSALLLVGVTLAGLRYHRQLENKQLIAIATYSEAESQRLSSAQNPFRIYFEVDSDQNPFTKFLNRNRNMSPAIRQ